MISQLDYYGKIADAGVPEIQQNGRYVVQKDAEKFVPLDVIEKLDIRPEDRFIDIGCGLGVNLVPVSKIVAQATGCDHPSVVDKLSQKHAAENVSYIGGDFLTLDFAQTYNKILIYSVLPALCDKETIFAFVMKGLSVLEPNGMMLVGDIANKDKKDRFLRSEQGKCFQEEWDAMRQENGDETDLSPYQAEAERPMLMDDAMVLELVRQIRQKGFHAYILDQHPALPFGNTREDILIVGPEYIRSPKNG